MAFTKITNADLAERGATTLPNQPNMSATALKQEFDAPAKEIVAPKFNNLIDELEAETAAASLGATAPEGRSGETVQEVIDDISEDLATVEGQFPTVLDSTTYRDVGGYRIFTFEDAAITTTSRFDFYADVFGVSPDSVTVSNGTLVINFLLGYDVTECAVEIK